MLREVSLSANPYNLTLVGDPPSIYILRVRGTESEKTTAPAMVKEIDRHMGALAKLRGEIEEDG